MKDATMTGPLFDGGPVMEQLEDESSLWFVRDELRDAYLVEVRSISRADVREIESNVRAGLDGRQTIRSSWLLALRAEARAAAGLDPIPLDRLGGYRIEQGWPEELRGFDALVAWALHQRAGAEAISVVESEAMRVALEASVGAARCPVCAVCVTGPSSGLCADCVSVLEVVRLDRARELGKQRIDGRVTRFDAVERWLAG